MKWSVPLALRLFLLNLGFSLLVFGAVAWWGTANYREQDERRALENARNLLDQANELVNGMYESLQGNLMLIATLPPFPDDDMAATYFGRVKDFSPLLRSIFIVHDTGIIQSDRPTLLKVLGAPTLMDTVAKARATPGRVMMTAPYRSQLSGQTIAFAFRPPRSWKPVSTMTAVVEIDLDTLGSRLQPIMSTRGTTLAIFTNDGQPVLFDAENPLLPIIARSVPRALDTSITDQWLRSATGENFLVRDQRLILGSGSNRAGWILQLIIDQNMIEESINARLSTLRSALFVLVLPLVLASILIAVFFSRPVRQLSRTMDHILTLDDLHPLETRRWDEIGTLIMSYNALIKRIQYMTLEVQQAEAAKKEYEIKMLQSQIGPHFLYNTLACIGTLAKRQQIGQVRSTIKELVNLLSFTFDKRGNLVPLQDELDAVRSYLAIQKTRYGDIFDLVIDTDAASLAATVPRLSLQPLVENAIFHGLAPLQAEIRRGNLRIIARTRGHQLLVRIIDNGLGVDRARLAGLLDTAQDTPGGDRLNSIGLSNVHQRLRQLFGSPYGLQVYSRLGLGTWIRLSVPLG